MDPTAAGSTHTPDHGGWDLKGENGEVLPLEHFRYLFFKFVAHGTFWFLVVLTSLVVSVYLGWLLPGFKWYVTHMDVWGLLVTLLTWIPLALALLHYSARIPWFLKGGITLLYWSGMLIGFNTPGDIAQGCIVIYYAILIMTASFLLPSWSALILALVYSASMLVSSGMSHTQIRLFDMAGLALAGVFSWFTGLVLETTYRSLQELNATLRASNQLLVTENQARASLEVELRVAASTAEKANRLKNQFLANVSHEIRTPLTSIMGFTQLIQKTHLEPEQKEYIRTIRHNSDLLLMLLNDILDFGKIESRQLKLEKIEFDLDYVLRSVTETLRERIQGKPLVLNVEYAASLPRGFKGDPTRIRQIFIHLLGNALKFTPVGEITVRVYGEGAHWQGAESVQRVCIMVRDTGIGIPRHAQEDVFKAFVQGDGSSTREFGGAGLGLTITRELVECMGGSIALESEVGAGSTFTVRLDLPEAALEQTQAFLLPTSRDLEGVGLLLIETNPQAKLILTRYVHDMGVRVIHAVTDISEALAWLEHAENAAATALILCEAQEDGGSDLKRLQALQQKAATAHIKLVAINSDAQPGNSQQAHREGYAGYLAKPFSQMDLKRVLQGVLGDHRFHKDQIVTHHLIQEYEQRAGMDAAPNEENQA